MQLATLPSAFGIDPWNTEQYQQLPLGAIGFDDYGNKYRYVKNNATNAMVLGTLQSRAALSTNFVDMAVTAAVLGAKTVTATLGGTATTANQFDGGRAVVSITPGIGQQMTIKSHDVQSTTSGPCNLNFYEPLTVALTTSSKLTVVPNAQNGVIISPTTFTGEPLGVALTTTAASYYSWVGTHGAFGVRSDGTGSQAVSKLMEPSTTTAGDVTLWVTTLPAIGVFIVAGVSTQVEPQWFNIN